MQDHNLQDHPVQDQHPRRRIPLGIAAGLSAVVLAVGGATAWWTWNASKTTDPVTTQPTPDVVETNPPVDTGSAPATAEQNVDIYWVTDTGTNLELVPYQVSLAAADNPSETLTAAFEALLDGPESAEATDPATSIPDGTRLLNLDVRQDGVYVDLSEEFTTGGGSTSMTGRLAQVLYTATSLDPDENVWLYIEGEPLEVLGGEGLIVDQPMTRAKFEQNFDL
jgi:spore germination protein GerM